MSDPQRNWTDPAVIDLIVKAFDEIIEMRRTEGVLKHVPVNFAPIELIAGAPPQVLREAVMRLNNQPLRLATVLRTLARGAVNMANLYLDDVGGTDED